MSNIYNTLEDYIIYKYCKCGNKLIYTDNSITTENGKYGETRGLYYCSKCNIIYDSDMLDLEDEYLIVKNKKYYKWFKDKI